AAINQPATWRANASGSARISRRSSEELVMKRTFGEAHLRSRLAAERWSAGNRRRWGRRRLAAGWHESLVIAVTCPSKVHPPQAARANLLHAASHRVGGTQEIAGAINRKKGRVSAGFTRYPCGQMHARQKKCSLEPIVGSKELGGNLPNLLARRHGWRSGRLRNGHAHSRPRRGGQAKPCRSKLKWVRRRSPFTKARRCW